MGHLAPVLQLGKEGLEVMEIVICQPAAPSWWPLLDFPLEATLLEYRGAAGKYKDTDWYRKRTKRPFLKSTIRKFEHLVWICLAVYLPYFLFVNIWAGIVFQCSDVYCKMNRWKINHIFVKASHPHFNLFHLKWTWRITKISFIC